MDRLSGNILIVESSYYEDITAALIEGASATLEAAEKNIERITVPGVFEIPASIQFTWNEKSFDGCITLGCVIRGETDHYEHICREVSRALMDISIKLNMPHGFGILTCENREQAWERADIKQKNRGARAAEACLQMVNVKTRI